MVGVVLISRKFHINPDNVATPFGGSLGDLTTIALLSSVAMLLFTIMGKLIPTKDCGGARMLLVLVPMQNGLFGALFPQC